MANKLYVLVRTDLTKSQQAVQACHAVADFMIYRDEDGCGRHWDNGTIVLLGVPNEEELVGWMKTIREGRFPTGDMFYEPDLPGYTSLAAYDTDGSLKQALKKLSLL